MDVQEVEQSTLRDRHRAYDYDMLVPQPLWFSDVLVPDEFAFVFADTTKNGIDGYFSGWKNEKSGHSSSRPAPRPIPTRTTLAPDSAPWNNETPWISTMWLPTITGIRNTECNIKVNGLGWYLFERAWTR